MSHMHKTSFKLCLEVTQAQKQHNDWLLADVTAGSQLHCIALYLEFQTVLADLDV